MYATCQDSIVSTQNNVEHEDNDTETKSSDESQDEETPDSDNSEMNVDCEERFSNRHTKEGSFAYI